MNVDEAREEYLAARETASAAYNAHLERPRAKYERALMQARLSKTDLTREEVAAWGMACVDARSLWHDIMAGPTADLDKALAEAKETTR